MDIRSVSGSPPQAPRPAERPDPAPAPAVRSDAFTSTAPAAPEKTAAQRRASDEQVDQALSSINNALQVRSQDLEFSIDTESDRTIVKVVDKHTQEVIRQMPSEEAIEIAKALDRLQSLLIRQTA